MLPFTLGLKVTLLVAEMLPPLDQVAILSETLL